MNNTIKRILECKMDKRKTKTQDNEQQQKRSERITGKENKSVKTGSK